MKSQRIPHPAASSPAVEPVFDLEIFVDRMHLGDTVARRAYELFKAHGSAPSLEVEEDWTKEESERLDQYVWGRRAA